MRYMGEWEVRKAEYSGWFASKKELKEHIASGGEIHLVNLAMYGDYAGLYLVGSELEENDTLLSIYGPNPSRGIPNKWYANLKVKNGKLKVV